MIRRPPRSTLDRSSAASDVYKRQADIPKAVPQMPAYVDYANAHWRELIERYQTMILWLSLIHISEPTRPY